MTRKIDPNPYLEDLEGYRRALQAEHGLRAVDDLVTALCTLVRRTDMMCHGCVWETVVKPLITPLVGWGRGYPKRQAKDPEESWKRVDLAEYVPAAPAVQDGA